MSSRVFYLYRYQLLPITTQMSFLYDIKSIIANKNKYFHEALFAIKSIETIKTRRKYKYEMEKYIDEYFMFIVSRQKNVKVILEDHTKSDVDSFPFSRIIIDNNDSNQIIAVQDSIEFSQKTIINSFKKYINKILIDNHLIAQIEPVYKESDFWSFIKENKEDITSISFNLITPNMSNISSCLSEDLKKAAKTTGAIETNLKFNSSSSGSLKIQPNNTAIDGLVTYASQGGGEISVKTKGSRLGFCSNDYQKTIEIDELDYKGDLNSLIALIREVTNDGNHR